MKSLWTFFGVGMGLGVIISLALHSPFARSDDPRIRKNEDPSMSGLKAKVPDSKVAEDELVRRQKELDERERLVKESEGRLEVEERRLQIRIDELQKIEEEVATIQGKNKERSDEIMKKVVKTFETMAPKKAAGILAAMEDGVVVDIVLSMKEKNVAAVLDVMDPPRATQISSLVAGRRPAGIAIGEKAGSAR